MCGRYALALTRSELEEFSGFNSFGLSDWAPRYNIAPSQTLPVIAKSGDALGFASRKWGFMPSWLRDPANVPLPINARGETAQTKAYFRTAFKSGRCLVPATSFFEWSSKSSKGDKRIPFNIFLNSKEPFYFAGLEENNSFCIVTTDAVGPVEQLHHRMPLILLDKDEQQTWLEGSPVEAKELVRPKANIPLEFFQISTEVNSPKNDYIEILKEQKA